MSSQARSAPSSRAVPSPFEAACAAVWANTNAGRLAAEQVGSAESVIATDVIEALPEALSS